jgi:hypothetical protein
LLAINEKHMEMVGGGNAITNYLCEKLGNAAGGKFSLGLGAVSEVLCKEGVNNLEVGHEYREMKNDWESEGLDTRWMDGVRDFAMKNNMTMDELLRSF